MSVHSSGPTTPPAGCFASAPFSLYHSFSTAFSVVPRWYTLSNLATQPNQILMLVSNAMSWLRFAWYHTSRGSTLESSTMRRTRCGNSVE